MFLEFEAEVIPVVADESWQRLPDVALGGVDILDYYLHFLHLVESAFVH